MALQLPPIIGSGRGLDLNQQISDLFGGIRKKQEAEKIAQAEQAIQNTKNLAGQFQSILDTGDFALRRRGLSRLGQELINSGDEQGFERVKQALAIENNDELRLFLTRQVTKGIAVTDQLGKFLADRAGGGKAGKFSAISEFLEGGGTRKINPDTGDEEIRNRFNEIVTGQDAVDVLQRSAKIISDREEATQDLRVETERDLKQVQNAEKTSAKAFDTIDKLRQNITNLEAVVPLIGQGANTGPISRLFPSVKAATIKLEQLQKRLSLDVVGAVTFGALSKGELQLAQAVAIPLGLEGDDLIQWVNDTITAKRKLAAYYEDQAIFLSNGGTQALWIEKQRADLQNLLNRADATEEDIIETMKEAKMSRSEVLDELRKRFPDGS